MDVIRVDAGRLAQAGPADLALFTARVLRATEASRAGEGVTYLVDEVGGVLASIVPPEVGERYEHSLSAGPGDDGDWPVTAAASPPCAPRGSWLSRLRG